MSERLDESAFVARLARELEDASDLRAIVATAGAARGAPARRLVLRFFGEAGARRASATRFEGKRQLAQETIALDALAKRLAKDVVSGFDAWSLERAERDLHVRRTKRGAFLASEGRVARRAVPIAHDRRKDRAIEPGAPILHALGLASMDGRVLPGRERKFRQMNQFVRLASESIDALATGAGALRILDAGCGAAYLSFALADHLRRARAIELLGVDLRDDVIDGARAIASELGMSELRFERRAIKDVTEPVDVVLSLHACDTATDEAIARGVALGARAILVVPCCQHELHKKIAVDALAPILRHGILRERFADLATDALRALRLRAAGFRAEVVEFIDPDATMKNVLIRAVRTGEPDAAARDQLAAAKRFLGIEEPLAIERLMGDL